MTGPELDDDTDLSWLLTPSPAPARGPDAIRARARRRRRGNRIALAGVAGIAVVAAATVGFTLARPGGGTSTLHVASSPTVPHIGPSTSSPITTGGSRTLASSPTTLPAALPAACAGGGTPRAGQARVGDDVSFGLLPPGYTVLPTAPVPLVSEQAQSTGAGGGDLTVSLFISGPLTAGLTNGSAQAVTIQGHPARLYASLGAHRQVTITWVPENGMLIEFEADNVATATAENVAQHVRYTPGRTAPSVGDLGPVVPRTTIVARARQLSAPSQIATAQAVLITAGQYYASPAESGTSLRVTDPIWVIELTGTFTLPNGAAPNLRNADHQTMIYDAVTGDYLGDTLGQQFTPGLVDHSTDPPCPLPPQD